MCIDQKEVQTSFDPSKQYLNVAKIMQMVTTYVKQ